MWDSICYLNGEYLPLNQAKVSVLDRGFIFGDGVYEVVPLYRSSPFEWQAHLTRLKRSLAAVQLRNPLSDQAWLDLVLALARKNPSENQFIYWQVTRGVAKRDQGFPDDSVEPTLFAMASPFSPPTQPLIDQGASGYSTLDNRWLRCDIKSISLLGNVLKRQEAIDYGATEAVMFREGYLTEGAAANIWVVKAGCLYSVPKDHRILTGVRMGLMQRLANAAGIPIVEQAISKAQVLDADEILLSSATKEVLPMTVLDERPVGHGAGAGKPGPVWRALFAQYQLEKARQCP